MNYSVVNPLLPARKLYWRMRQLYKVHVLKDDFSIEVARWFKDKGDETLRLDYPGLGRDSIVFDLGGYLGDFAYEINNKYGCRVYVFEPHPEFYEACVKRFADNPDIKSFNFGIADSDGRFALSESADGSSFLNPSHATKQGVECEVREFFSVLSDLGIREIDLMKINIEGGEYPLLQHIADRKKVAIVREYQIQFHNFIENAENRRNMLVNTLKKTHSRTWCYEFVWENWRRI